MADFHVILTEDAADGGYVVTVPEIPGLVTEGDSVDEAMKRAKDAIKTYLSYKTETSRAIVKILHAGDLNLSASA